MSTILETLKKLEDDKRSRLDKDLDLKELVLRENTKVPARKTVEISHKNFIVMGLVLAVGLICGALFWGGNPSADKEGVRYSEKVSIQKPIHLDKNLPEPTVGIPLSNIPEQHFREDSPAALEPASHVQRVPAPVTKPEVLYPDISEIRDRIHIAKLEAQQSKFIGDSLEPVSRGVSIPNLRVKGIIFFSPASSSNHIFVSTSESNNQKVRVGESVQSATLTQIESNRVVFSYRGESVHLRIGE